MNVFSRLARFVPALLVGVLAGGAGVYWWAGQSGGAPGGDTADEKEPLYWVAPMDDSYRRDSPGKSPMGMDLVPVYEESAAEDGPGTVSISPQVVNNLGVRTATVQRDRLPGTIRTVGYVRYDEDRLVHIHPRVEGWVEKLHVKAEGDPVEKGQPLYELYAPELVSAQRDLLLALREDDPRLVRGARRHLRALNFAEKSIDRLIETREVMQTVTFYAPQSGVVDNLGIREGYFVQPSLTMMSIGVLDQVWVEAEVFARNALAVAPGQAVTMTLDFLPGRQWQGEVDYIYPSLNAETRTLRLRLKFANPDRVLKPNMFANIAIDTPTDPALLVPREAVIRTGHQNRVVMTDGEGRFKSVQVTLGRVGKQEVQVLDGLQSGDRIVTSAQFLIDSESAKESDFKRLTAPDKNAHNMEEHDMSGHDMEGHDMDGHDTEGHDTEGHDMEGHDMEGHSMETNDGQAHTMEEHDMSDHSMEGDDRQGHDMNGDTMDHQSMSASSATTHAGGDHD